MSCIPVDIYIYSCTQIPLWLLICVPNFKNEIIVFHLSLSLRQGSLELDLWIIQGLKLKEIYMPLPP